MANDEHVALLKQGVGTWNEWRKNHPHIHPDFRGASLDDMPLGGAELAHADFHEASLCRVDLRHAKIYRANLEFANLQDARLQHATLQYSLLHYTRLPGAHCCEADLYEVNFLHADLQGADLSKANLMSANLNEATLHGANLAEAQLSRTIFANTELTHTRGLASCHHHGPSPIDIHTLLQSGPLPLAFLRGCGLPDTLIEYLPSLLTLPLQFYSCFISYSNKDEAFARRLYADLQDRGVRCWFAPEDMKIGDEFRSRIDQAIHIHDRLLLILSKHSVKSRWVQKEVETAFEKEDREHRPILFPVRLDDAVMDLDVGWAADIRRQRHIGDFRQWKEHDAYQKSFVRLLRDLKATEEKKEEVQ